MTRERYLTRLSTAAERLPMGLLVTVVVVAEKLAHQASRAGHYRALSQARGPGLLPPAVPETCHKKG